MNIAIVGASGAVGQEFMRVLAEQGFPVDRLTLFGSSRSAGRTYTFAGKECVVRELRDNDDFKDIDFAFVSAGASTSRDFAATITRHGTVMIDNSSAFRDRDDVPLVVPEVNGADALGARDRIISNPNCTTIQMVVALNPIHRISPVTQVHVATYQSASGAGARAMAELVGQHAAITRGEQPEVERFAHQLAYNLIPHIDIFTDNDYTKEEMKMYHETKKIMHAPELNVSATCVRVPVLRAHSEAIWLHTAEPVSVDTARRAWRDAPGVTLIDEPASGRYPMPLEAAGTDPVFVGRVRKDLTDPNGLTFWTVADQIKKGAALNAVQIAQYIIAHR